MNEAQYVFGIDLGATYSAIAYLDARESPHFKSEKQNTVVIPSAVFFQSPTNVLVGQAALDAGRIEPENLVGFIKYGLGESGSARVIHGDHRPEEILTFILRKLAQDIEALLKYPVSEVVIGVPAYFHVAQRESVIRAAEHAGLNVSMLINEATLVALAYGLPQKGRENVLVYDLGGAGFDVSVLQVDDDEIRVVNIDGDHHLGGRDWDDRLARYLVDEWQRKTGSTIEMLDNPKIARDLLGLAEGAKKLLSSTSKASIAVTLAGQSVLVELTRETFDGLTNSLLERTIRLTHGAITEAVRSGISNIDCILLAGGSAFMPQVLERLAREFPTSRLMLSAPDLSIARGAAIRAARAHGETTASRVANVGRSTGVMVQDVSSMNIGVITSDENGQEVVTYLIRQDSVVPIEVEQQVVVAAEGQTEAIFRVVRSRGLITTKSGSQPGWREIGRLILDLPPGLPASSPIRIKCGLSNDGVLYFEAMEPFSGQVVGSTMMSEKKSEPELVSDLAAKRSLTNEGLVENESVRYLELEGREKTTVEADHASLDPERTASEKTTSPPPFSDEVELSVTGPLVVVAASAFVLQVWASLRTRVAEVLEKASAAQGGKEIMVFSKGPVILSRGTRVTVRLKLPRFHIEDVEDTLLWTGSISNASFSVNAPADLTAGSYNGVVEAFYEGLRVAKIHFTITVGERPAPVGDMASNATFHKSAFASYATQDRDSVLGRIQGIQKILPTLKIFLDVQSLRSGDNWKKRIEDEVTSRDILYLFWSQFARQSEYVDWEWRTAFRAKGIDGIDPVPLISPEEAPPPKELAELHFNDWVLAFMRRPVMSITTGLAPPSG
jgi:molecular chaperone DnaK